MTSNALLERVAAIEAHASEAEARQRVELGNALLRRVAAIEAEHAAEAAAEGRGEAEAENPDEAEDPDEAEGPAEAEDQVVAVGLTDSTRLCKLRADFAAWLVAIGKKAGLRGGKKYAQKFITSLDGESSWLSDSRLTLMQTVPADVGHDAPHIFPYTLNLCVGIHIGLNLRVAEQAR